MRAFFVAVLVIVAQGTSQRAASSALADGSYDPTFGDGGRKLSYASGLSAPPVRMGSRPDGRVLLVGDCGANHYICAAQLMADGESYDSKFGPGGQGYVELHALPGFYSSCTFLSGVQLLADGRIVVVASSCEGRTLIAVLEADGSDLDRNVAGGAGWLHDDTPQIVPTSVAVQSDGNIVIGGGVIGADGNVDMIVGRWLSDLSGRDLTFAASSSVPGIQYVAFDLQGPDSGLDVDDATAVAVLPDGRILLGGYAETAYGYTPAFAMLLSGGSPDENFGSAGQTHVDWQADCGTGTKMIVDRHGRTVFSCNGTIGRIDASGIQDSTFAGTGKQPLSATPIDALALQPDGKIVAATHTSGYLSVIVARLARDGALDSSFGPGGTVQRTLVDASITGCSSCQSSPSGLVFADQRGLRVSGWGQSQSGSTNQEFGVMQLTADVIFGDGFGD